MSHWQIGDVRISKFVEREFSENVHRFLLFCWMPPLKPATESTRRQMLTQLATESTVVIGTHFSPPTAGRVVRDGDVWRFETAV